LVHGTNRSLHQHDAGSKVSSIMRETNKQSNRKHGAQLGGWYSKSCDRSRFLISKSLEIELSWQEKFHLYAHLSTCGSCRHYRQHLRIIRRMIRCYCSRHPEASSGWQLSAEARERLKKLIQDKMRKPNNQRARFLSALGFSFSVYSTKPRQAGRNQHYSVKPSDSDTVSAA
jgi:hypothetical protein